MNVPRFFKLPKHRQFNYQPIYYDPAKEEREKRNLEIERELGIKKEGETYTPSLRRGTMRHYFQAQKRSRRNSNLRLILIMTFLFFLAYMLLYR